MFQLLSTKEAQKEKLCFSMRYELKKYTKYRTLIDEGNIIVFRIFVFLLPDAVI